MSFCNAGHQKCYLCRKSDKPFFLLNTDGTVMGVSKDLNFMFKTEKISVEKGDKIILFTDGITEARNIKGEEFGTEGLEKSLRKSFGFSGEKTLNTITKDLAKFTDYENLNDDVTVFVIELV